mgnify:CR=1 FL=1
MKRYALWVTLACGPLGCATVRVGEYDFNPDQWNKDRAAVTSRAAFDLQCGAEAIEVTPLTASDGFVGLMVQRNAFAKQVGVQGCGKRAAYTRVGGTWIKDSETAPELK